MKADNFFFQLQEKYRFSSHRMVNQFQYCTRAHEELHDQQEEELEVTVLIEQQQVETQLLAMIQWWEQSGSGITPLPDDVFLYLLQQWFEEKKLDVLADDMTLNTLLQWHEETLTQQEQEQVLVQQVLEEQDYQDKLIVMAIVKDEEERHGSPEG